MVLSVRTIIEEWFYVVMDGARGRSFFVVRFGEMILQLRGLHVLQQQGAGASSCTRSTKLAPAAEAILRHIGHVFWFRPRAKQARVNRFRPR